MTFSQLQNKIKMLELKARDLTPMLAEVGNITQNESELSFEREKSPFNEKWKPLSKKTLAKKKSSKILTESARLSHSISYQVQAPKSVLVGTNIQYAAIHQFGGKAGRNKSVKIPARPFMPFNAKGEIPKILKKDIETIIKNHFNL